MEEEKKGAMEGANASQEADSGANEAEKPAKTPWKWSWKNFLLSFLWLVPLLILIDQLTKWGMVNAVNGREYASIEVISHFFYLTLTFNKGSSFGMGSDVPWMRYVFIVISWAASAAIIWYWVKSLKRQDVWLDVILALCLSGAIGNAIDRTFYWEGTVGFSGVIDFFQFYIFGYDNASFAIFNVADALLVVGIALLIAVTLIRELRKHK